MITQEQLNDMLEAAKPSIIEGFKKDIQESINWEVRQTAASLIRREVETWISKNIIPEIHRQLVESKNGFLKLGTKLGEGLVEVLIENLLIVFKDNLQTGYKRRDIFKSMFN